MVLLQKGKTTAYEVYKDCQLKKPTVYVILNQLVTKGFAFKIPYAKKQIYWAEDPEKCFADYREKFQQASEKIPVLKAVQNKQEEKVNVAYFEGIEGIKSMYEKLLKNVAKNEKFDSFLAHCNNTPSKILDYFEEFNQRRVDLNISVKGITPNDRSNQKWLDNQKQYLLDLKAIDKEKYDSSINITILKNITQLISLRHLQGVAIENPDIAKALKQILELLWELLEEKERREK